MPLSKKNVDNPPDRGPGEGAPESPLAVPSSNVSSVTGSATTTKTHQRVSSSSERQIKFERAQKCLENAALVSKRIKEHRKATAELLGRPFEDDVTDTASEMASTMSERTGYSAATDTSTTLSVQEALNIPGISESLANTLKQKEILMERIKQYKEISKRPSIMKSPVIRRESVAPELKETPKPTATASSNAELTLLQNKLKEKENALNIMQVKMRAMEATVMDLQEKIGEKDQVIEAKTKATTLMSDSLSKKEKDSVGLLDDTRQQMTHMQENFIAMETEWKEEKQRLLTEINQKDEKLRNLEEANFILENSRFEICVTHSKLAEELEVKNKEILQLQENLDKLSQEMETVKSAPESSFGEIEEEKGSKEISQMEELTKRVELLEQLNCQIRQANKELENKLTISHDPKNTSSPSKKASPLPTRKGGRNTAARSKSPWSNLSSEPVPQETDKKQNKTEVAKLELVIQSLNKEILDKEFALSQKESLVSNLKESILVKEALISDLSEKNTSTGKSAVDTADKGVVTETVEVHSGLVSGQDEADITGNTDKPVESKEELTIKLRLAEQQIEALNNEIDSANKNMVKVKSNHKLKIKQMQKTIDNFCKVSDSNAEIIKLNEELHQLSQKVAELEEEKGNLQLHLVDYDSGRLTDSDAYKKMVEMENLAETRLNAISLLETQKFDLVQELHDLQQKNAEMEDKLSDISQLQNEHVCSEIRSAQLEEQIDSLIASKKELELVIDNLKLDKEQLNGSIKHLQDDKEELSHKLDHYLQENIELTDKLEKLSAEKVSSAESIEIVESFTTQEKLELEQYHKRMVDHKSDHPVEQFKEPSPHEHSEIEKLVQESAELNMKIELFTHERQEVMERLNKLSSENKSLQENILQLDMHTSNLQNSIDNLNQEKQNLQTLNDDLSLQIEELKREKINIMKESVDGSKPVTMEDSTETLGQDVSQEDKSCGDKGNKGAKSVKQLTKEILKLKNIIKEREAEIGDCQMKILSLEEHQQKQNESLQSIAANESKLKILTEENNNLKEELSSVKNNKDSENQMLQLKENNEFLQKELQKCQQEYTATINIRDAKIAELERLLLEYEKQIQNCGNSLQQKDKELSDYINQITKLNEVSQKLKSTIELLEEEKAKDQNAELVKSLNKQIASYQKKLTENEEKHRFFEEEKTQLLSLKNALENKTISLESEIHLLQKKLSENQVLISKLQDHQEKHKEEMSAIKQESKVRDEEIHEIKLQLRKESIENEKLRTNVDEKEKTIQSYSQELEEMLNKAANEQAEISEKCGTLETKNKELLEKMKKYAVTLKKKTFMYNEMEVQLNEKQGELEQKNKELEQLSVQYGNISSLQEKWKQAEEELKRISDNKVNIETQQSHDMTLMLKDKDYILEQLRLTENEVAKYSEEYNVMNIELLSCRDQNAYLNSQLESLNHKIAEYEIEHKNISNLETKIKTLEHDLSLKHNQINELMQKLETQAQSFNQLQFGHDAKVQERDLYIENLESEIYKYKTRICRLEESISVMEARRHSLERKADQLDSQLQEKHKAYSEYSNHEDELVNRLAVLIDHDRVVEKQLHEIESENKELQNKMQNINEENQKLRNSLSDIHDDYIVLTEKSSRTDSLEVDAQYYQEKIKELESNLKKIRIEHQNTVTKNSKDMEELETEFNTQIENAIKEKKALSEKYEKLSEHVLQLEQKHQEYSNTIQNLNSNLDELTRINQELIARKTTDSIVKPDYTEQYISEINKLNAIINNKNQEIQTLNDNSNTLQSSLQAKMMQLNDAVQQASFEIQKLMTENKALVQVNEQIQLALNDKEHKFKQLLEKKTVAFEMNIPKTEGMIISSRIEALNVDPGGQSSLESQIISNVGPALHHPDKKQKSSQNDQKLASGEIEEPILVAKKAYLCYKGEDESKDEKVGEDVDPFNSDEGWGLGETETEEEIMPGFTQFNAQILQLKQDNEILRADLAANNTKLMKALKKLKELKATNEILTKELSISKQMSHSSFLDSAIEDELKIHTQDLEKKLEELTSELNKEKREKESFKKQNEVFHNANDRLTEMKEKLDNELELWKFKFKQANDKVSALQWGSESNSPEHKAVVASQGSSDSRLTNEILKLEKENDEIQLMLDQLTSENKKLIGQHTKLKDEIHVLNQQLMQQQTATQNSTILQTHIDQVSSQNNELISQQHKLNDEINYLKDQLQQQQSYSGEYDNLKEQVKELHEERSNLVNIKHKIEEKMLQLESLNNEINMRYEKLNEEYLETQKIHQADRNGLIDKCKQLEENCSSLKLSLDEANTKICLMTNEQEQFERQIEWLEQQKDTRGAATIDTSDFIDTEKYNSLEDQFRVMKSLLDEANNKITLLENKNLKESSCPQVDEGQINQLNNKIQHLNAENDQLLSTVAELRSSIASAMDQRGFEIAELWKQHLAQREADFQKTEQELRSQLNAAETKYEQLLDNVQSSSQEETNKLVMVEQINAVQAKLQDKEEHLINLQNQYAEVINQLDILRSEMNDDKLTFENKLMALDEDNEKQIKEISGNHQLETEKYEQAVKELHAEVAASKEEITKLTIGLQKSNEARNELETKIIDYTAEIRMKETEVYQKSHDYSIAAHQRNEEFENVRKQMIDYEKRLEDLTYEKEAELAALRLKLHENTEYYENIQKGYDTDRKTLTEELNAKIIECTTLNRQIAELNQTIEEYAVKATEMQTALENQELEIVTLGDEVENLQRLLQITKIDKHVSFSSDTKPAPEEPDSWMNKELLDAVPRAELDLALYMLHQRDVRCEELTLELTQLLEERDTLQLRLSDSLRSREELKSRCKAAGFDLGASLETVTEVPTVSVEREAPGQPVDIHRAQSSRSSSISDPDADKPNLQAKLTEIRSVRQNRDVRLRQDSEHRQLGMRLMHRDIANLPPEAVEQLQQAHHTLSRDSQSTSTVLLNWFRGKSTPKVVHDM